MIVRDEQEMLQRAISSFKGLAEEVVIVDTGSIDDTIAVAESLGARVVRHEWRDDFSAARNAGFDAATGEWVFALDADEHLLPDSREEVKRLTAVEDPAQGYLVTRRDVTQGGVSEMMFFRLGRRDLNRRLVGRIHEHFEPPLTQVQKSGIVIQHEGYARGNLEAKLRRNVRLLEMELADRPTQPYYLADLAHSYRQLGDSRWPSVLDQTMQAIDLEADRSPLVLMPALLEMALTADSSTLPKNLTPAQLEALADRWYPSSVPLLAARCRLAFGGGEMARAAELGERAAKAWDTESYDRTMSFNPAIVGAEFRLNLGAALARSGRFEEALIRFAEADSDPQFEQVARQNADAVRAAMG